MLVVAAVLTRAALAERVEPLVDVYSSAIEPGKTLTIPVPAQTIKRIIQSQNGASPQTNGAATLRLKLSVVNPKSSWTLLASPKIRLENGANKYEVLPFTQGKPNLGPMSSGAELELSFELDDKFDSNQDSQLVIPNGVYSWSAPAGEYVLNVYAGFKLQAEFTVDKLNRLYRIKVNAIPEMNRFVWTIPADDEQSYSQLATRRRGAAPDPRFRASVDNRSRWSLSSHSQLATRNSQLETQLATFPTVQVETSQGKLKRRFPEFADGRKEFDVLLDAYVDGQPEPTRVTVHVKGNSTPLPVPLAPGERLVGLCFYKGDKCVEYVDELIDQKLGNLAVFWPGAPASNQSGVTERDVVAKLADNGVYSMTIYKRDSRQQVEELTSAAKNRYFLNNNIGEFASFLYQDARSAQACHYNMSLADVMLCRDALVETYVGWGAKLYHSTYDYVFSTSGSSLANYELEGGVDFMCSELYAIGAQNLAWASAEMRGAARKWQPEFWGGWLAHEWQTCDYPFQAPQKFQLLKAGLYQQYLMGSRFIVLESGSQSTQAGKYTAQSDKKDFGHDGSVPTEYRRQMKEFYAFIQQAPKRLDSPQTHIAVAMGNGDCYVGMYMHSAVWAQHEAAAKDPRWKYGPPERLSQAVQQVFFPLDPSATAPYNNRFLAGSPYGQTDVVFLDDFTRLKDLTRYKLVVCTGWNTMTPGIVQTLSQYVRQGGTVFLVTPQLSTRTDREYALYAPSDLIANGVLKPLIDMEIVDRQDASGTVESDWLTEGKERLETSIARFNPTEPSADSQPLETLASIDGKPLLVRQRQGKGAVYLLLTWTYPGEDAAKTLLQSILKKLGKEFSGTKAGDIDVLSDTLPSDSLCWAVYEDSVDLLNLDCSRSRTVTIALPGSPDKPITVTLSPTELKTISK